MTKEKQCAMRMREKQLNPKCFIITTFCELRIEQLCLLIGSQNGAPVFMHYANGGHKTLRGAKKYELLLLPPLWPFR